MMNGAGGGPWGASDAIVAQLGKGPTTGKVVAKLVEEARRYKPAGCDDLTAKLRLRYHSRGEGLVKAELERRYPNTHAELPVVETDTVRHAATQDATVFGDDPPNCWLDFGDDDEERPVAADSDRRSQALVDLLEASEAWDELAEAERWTRAARNCVLKLSPDMVSYALDGQPRVRIDRYWADQVQIVPFWAAPTDERAAVALVFSSSGPDTRKSGGDGLPSGKHERWWELWYRSAEILPDGTVKLGEWHAELVGEESGARPLYGDGVWPLTTPCLVLMRDGKPDATIFLDPGDTLLNVANAIDVEWCNHFQRSDLNGSPMLFLDDPELEGKDLEIGAGRATVMQKGSTATSVAADVTDVGLKSISQLRRELAIQRQQAPDAYEPEKGGAESGFAKQVKNLDRDRAHRTRTRAMKRWCETRFLPALVAVSDYWFGTDILHTKRVGSADGGLTPEGRLRTDADVRVEFPGQVSYESDEERDRRVLQRITSGAVSAPDGLVEMRVASTTEEAEEYLKSFGSPLLRRASLDAASEQAVKDLGAALDGVEQPKPKAHSADPRSAAPVEDVQKTALNGAQITSMTQTVKDVALGELPRDSGVAIIKIGFQLSPQEAEEVMGSAGKSFTPASQAAPASPSPPSAGGPPDLQAGLDAIAGDVAKKATNGEDLKGALEGR